MRLPQNAPIASSAPWEAPPPGWVFGNWKVTKSSHPLYPSLHNFEVDLSPVFPQSTTNINQTNDLSAYNMAGSDQVMLAYGVDTWNFDTGIYVFKGGSISYQLEVLAWGYDTDGVAYKVTYEQEAPAIPAPPALSVESRLVGGPTNETMAKIIEAIEALGYKHLTELGHSMRDMVHNGERDGKPVICDAKCINGLP
ncbi:hypothetical protein MAPG_01254 [Magnaporthiopsis poae ATCC 64411]|uniref:Uncharacterized protein n=1 Tax=Magnaporthiopsis poae (strain ATCC 64411 / 73-15) TaxID=644358 RepID=A0A0C4DN75_MAGP6|nr:hypothetical protein MAPG_01254 [Magnaporthiopsis poae ATCC 64411]